jgi:hypothetical protein
MAALTNALVGDYRLLEFLGAGGMGKKKLLQKDYVLNKRLLTKLFRVYYF